MQQPKNTTGARLKMRSPGTPFAAAQKQADKTSPGAGLTSSAGVLPAADRAVKAPVPLEKALLSSQDSLVALKDQGLLSGRIEALLEAMKVEAGHKVTAAEAGKVCHPPEEAVNSAAAAEASAVEEEAVEEVVVDMA